MLNKRLIGCLVVGMSVFSSLSFALDLPRFYGEEVVVTAARLPLTVDPLLQTPANVTIITKEEIEKSGATNLSEVLNQYEGTIVADSLGFGLEANVGLRGFGGEGKNVLILVDGVRISETFDNTLFWKLIPLGQVKRVEIIRGGGASIYGGGALAGVINILTDICPDRPTANIEANLGSYGQRKMVISAGGLVGKWWQCRADINSEKFTGYRKNSGYDEVSAAVKLGRKIADDKNLDISFNNHVSQNGIAGGITREAMDNDPTQQNESASNRDKYNNKLSLLSLNYNYGSTGINIFSEQRVQNSYMIFSGNSTSEINLTTNSLGTTIQSVRRDQVGNNRNTLTYGLEYRHDAVNNPGTYNSPLYSSATDKGVGKNIWGIFAQNNLVIKEKLVVSLAARYDREDIDLIDKLDSTQNKFRRVSHLSPKFGVVFNLSSIFSAYVNLAQSFKAPEANAMIYEAPGLFSPNPDIDPTVANNYEVGLHLLDTTGNESKIAAYWIDSEREILFNVFAAPFSKNENFNTLRRGLEFSFKKVLTEKLSVAGGYTFGHAVFKSGAYEGKRIPLTPQDKYTAQFDYSFWENLGFRLDWLGVNGQFALNDFNNAYPVSAYNVWNSRLAWSSAGSDIYLAVRNLLDEKYSVFTASNAAGLVRYNPAPERSLLAGMKWEF